MDGDVAGAHTNGSKGEETFSTREVMGHYLFEIATEVANRGGTQSYYKYLSSVLT